MYLHCGERHHYNQNHADDLLYKSQYKISDDAGQQTLLAELPASEQTSEKLLRQAIIKLNF